jgi:hypothetical protein
VGTIEGGRRRGRKKKKKRREEDPHPTLSRKRERA